jgi:sensor domain CHASE-containing protein
MEALIVLIPIVAAAIVSIIVALRRQNVITEQLTEQGEKVQEVHLLVNQRLTDVLKRVEQLTSALEKSDTPVPDDPAPSASVR